MKKDKITEAVSMLDDDLISEANVKQIQRPRIVKYASIAASLTLACIITFSYIGISLYNKTGKNPDSNEESAVGHPILLVTPLPPADTFESIVTPPPLSSVFIPSSSAEGTFQNQAGAKLTVLLRDDHSISFTVDDRSFNSIITLNIFSNSGERYVFSTDSTKNTLVDGTVKIFYNNKYSNGVYVKINYGDFIPVGYTVDKYIEIDGFGKIPLSE